MSTFREKAQTFFLTIKEIVTAAIKLSASTLHIALCRLEAVVNSLQKGGSNQASSRLAEAEKWFSTCSEEFKSAIGRQKFKAFISEFSARSPACDKATHSNMPPTSLQPQEHAPDASGRRPPASMTGHEISATYPPITPRSESSTSSSSASLTSMMTARSSFSSTSQSNTDSSNSSPRSQDSMRSSNSTNEASATSSRSSPRNQNSLQSTRSIPGDEKETPRSFTP